MSAASTGAAPAAPQPAANTAAGMPGFAPPNRALTTIGLALASFMQVLDTTIANVSLPAISGNLGEALLRRVNGNTVVLGHGGGLRVEGKAQHAHQVEHVDVGVDRLAHRALDKGRIDRAVLRSDGDGRPRWCVKIVSVDRLTLTELPDPVAGPGQVVIDVAHAGVNFPDGLIVAGKYQVPTVLPVVPGVEVSGTITGLKPGAEHGFHIHEKGDCSSGDGMSAGGHFNPGDDAHGRVSGHDHHAGDMDNIVADAKGVAHVDVHADGPVRGGGAPNDALGRAVIVHAAPDDYVSQPSGNAGARVACGIIEAG